MAQTAKKDRNALKAGLFMLAAVALLVGVLVGIKGVEEIVEPMQVRHADFALTDDLGGLNVGDDVRIGGYRVGVVREIRLDTASGAPRLLVQFSLPKKYQVRQGALLAVQGTLTGVSWLNFQSLGDGAPLSADSALRGHPGAMTVLGDQIAAMAPKLDAVVTELQTKTLPGITATVDKFGKTADAVTAASDRTNSAIDEIHKNLPAMIERYLKVADRTAEMMAELRDILGDTKGDIRKTLANLAAVTTTAKDKLPAVLDKTDSALAKTDAAVAAVQTLLADNRHKIDSMIESLKTMADNLRGASAEIRRSPWRLLYKPGPDELANLNLFDAAREFARGAADLSDASAALKAALADPHADQERIQTLMKSLDIRAQRFDEVKSKLWNAVQP